MTSTSVPRVLGRTTVAAGATALLALGMAAPAAADGLTRAQYMGSTGPHSLQVHMDGQRVGTTLFTLALESGDTVTTYCIDLKTSTVSRAWYVEDSWANYPGKGDFAEPGKVHWILQNSYPTVSAQELGRTTNLHRLTDSEAVAATQAAIWHFTNGADLTRADGNVKKLYDYLVGEAQDLPQEPTPSLAVTSVSTEGEAGATVGEFTIETSAASVPVVVDAPEGVELVDLETGEAVSAVENGDTVGFEVPAGTEPGEASFSLETTAEVHAGRLFKGENTKRPTQTMITAETEEVTVTADGRASWTAGETEEPPVEEPPAEEPPAESTPPAEEPPAEDTPPGAPQPAGCSRPAAPQPAAPRPGAPRSPRRSRRPGRRR